MVEMSHAKEQGKYLTPSDVQGSAQSPEARAAEPQKPDPSQALERAW